MSSESGGSHQTTTGKDRPEALQGRNEHPTMWLMRRIWDNVNIHNEHFMGVIVGQEGSGKSYTALKIAHLLDDSFTADRVIFDIAELLSVLKDGDHQPGNFYVLDEAGVQMGRRTWQDRGQVLANQALQLIRNHNLGLLFTLPRLSELDSQAQGRMQGFLEMTEKVDGEYVSGKWKWLDPDRSDSTGKVYKKYPRRRIGGSMQRITRVSFSPPDEAIVEPYEERKQEFQEEFYEETIAELSGEDPDAEDEEDGMSVQEIAEEVADSVDDFTSIHGGNGTEYINHDLIRVEYDLSRDDAKAVKSLVGREVDI